MTYDRCLPIAFLLAAATFAACRDRASLPGGAATPAQPSPAPSLASAQRPDDAAVSGHDAGAPAPRPFANPDLSDETRIDDLLSALTPDEKLDCLSPDPQVPRLGLRLTGHVEGLHGLALGGPGGWGRGEPIPTTMFPQAVGLAETWDPELVKEVARVEATEARWMFHARQRGGIIVRAPNADLARDPRWGRAEESYGEDPYLAGAMATAFVRGLQGDDPSYWRAASLLKHFVANTNENGRGHTSSDFDDRLFHEYYAAAFRAAIVDGGARAYMAAYNAHNGVPCTTHPMLEDVTVRLWGQNGIKCTDASALAQLVNSHKAFADLSHAAAAAIKAGISQFLDKYRDAVADALRAGLLSESDIDRVLRQNFRVMLRLGLLDPPERVAYAQVDPKDPPWQRAEHKSLARRATQESIVLLKNDRDLLPLDATKLGSIAVVGPRASEVLLDWYSGMPPYSVPPLEGIKRRLGPSTKLVYARDDSGGFAVQAAKSAEVAVVVVGNHPTGDVGSWAMVALPSYGREAVDRQSITLEDEELVRKVYAVNPRTVVVLLASFPYAIGWTLDHVPAIVHATHASQELGTALADVLFGAFDPAGRLVETWPRAIQDLPPMMDYDIRHGRTYQYFKGKPLFAFGYGLSYTKFAYAGLASTAESLPRDGSIAVRFDVKNVGARDGDEVAQLYVTRPGSAAGPIEELKGFRRVRVAAGATEHVELPLRGADLGRWDVERKSFVVEPGPVEIRVGSSAADVKLSKTIVVTP
ncbi:MAG TPA: glycoside hydrolase family 3 C-terminal domain-containing protein [Polyangiaceae bacterium]|nr:glycoside hydrolase family 3 C-terminal domain-containing protein [Polyangiaceae bacterium]